jgi:hypothetical protein
MTQQETADWMGYASIQAMNADHDNLHQALCDWLGLTSHALRVARGEKISYSDYCLANYEEDAVLHLQRFIQRSSLNGHSV